MSINAPSELNGNDFETGSDLTASDSRSANTHSLSKSFTQLLQYIGSQ